jgi:hypothetical protein
VRARGVGEANVNVKKKGMRRQRQLVKESILLVDVSVQEHSSTRQGGKSEWKRYEKQQIMPSRPPKR